MISRTRFLIKVFAAILAAGAFLVLAGNYIRGLPKNSSEAQSREKEYYPINGLVNISEKWYVCGALISGLYKGQPSQTNGVLYLKPMVSGEFPNTLYFNSCATEKDCLKCYSIVPIANHDTKPYEVIVSCGVDTYTSLPFTINPSDTQFAIIPEDCTDLQVNIEFAEIQRQKCVKNYFLTAIQTGQGRFEIRNQSDNDYQFTTIARLESGEFIWNIGAPEHIGAQENIIIETDGNAVDLYFSYVSIMK